METCKIYSFVSILDNNEKFVSNAWIALEAGRTSHSNNGMATTKHM